MTRIDSAPQQSKEYIKVLQGTLLAVLSGIVVQGCSRVDSGVASGIPTSPSFSMDPRQTIATKQAEKTGIAPKIIFQEAAPEEPIVTIMGPDTAATKSAGEEEVPISIILDGPTEEATQSQKPTLTVSFDGPTTMQPGETLQQSNPEQPPVEFSTLEPERLKDIIKKVEKGPADDEIYENGRRVEVYSAPLKNGLSLIHVKESVGSHWDAAQSNVIFYDKNNQYVAYNTVQFGKRTLNDGTQEIRFGKGKSSAIIRNAYVTQDPSGVSVLLTTRNIDESLDILSRSRYVSIKNSREEMDPVTFQRTANIGGYVANTIGFLREWEWQLDESGGNRVYSVGRQSDGKFRRESIGDPVEINPSDNMGMQL